MIDCGSYHMDAWLLQSPNLLAFGSLVHSWTLELVLVNWVLFGFVQGELVRALGGAVASTSLLGVPLGHNSSFLQGPTFAPSRIREAIWCGSTNSTTEEAKKNTRGPNRMLKELQLVRMSASLIKIAYDERHRGAVTSQQHNSVVNCCGFIIRNFCPMRWESWAKIPEETRTLVRDNLEVSILIFSKVNIFLCLN
ncbi:hypothetical protein DVH24_026644 [Malus domestica]|uniref:Uncharacterized protein n=1 Tax=Malus domestica TaxID=3750 RepID=A0A498K741_MALDO|nr:hypothetical protein DVH24_026644 [Malus domestica]